MIVLRKRLLFWLIKAYFKKWGKNILIYFGLGLVVFFLLNKVLSYSITRLPFIEKETIGMVGSYTIDSLPREILSKISKGLTRTEIDGTVKPDNGRSLRMEKVMPLFFTKIDSFPTAQI